MLIINLKKIKKSNWNVCNYFLLLLAKYIWTFVISGFEVFQIKIWEQKLLQQEICTFDRETQLLPKC